MLSDTDVIRLLAILHDDPDPAGPTGSSLPPWTTLIHSALGPVGHIRQGDRDTIFFPGTKDAIDIWLDGDAWPADMGPRFGKIDPGFMAKPLCLKKQLDKLTTGQSVALVGHSKGAAEAQDYGALRLSEGLVVTEIVVFGSPMPGCAELQTLLAPVPMRNYRNGWHGDVDPIPGYPFPIPVEFPCLQMRDFIALAGRPDDGDTGEFRAHHSQCYFRGLVARS